MNHSRTKIALLGSTGSIGHQTLEVVRMHADHFSLSVLTAQSQWQLLAEQALEFRPDAVIIGEPQYYTALYNRLHPEGIEVYAGNQTLCDWVSREDIDVVVVALVGYAGLLPTLRSLEAGKLVALANKETLVVAGELVMEQSARYNAPIVPLDSEHSAIYQCLVGELSRPEKLIITASGGPFRGMTPDQLEQVTPEQALSHPTWSMGAKISVDSATLMNKGLEVIEAHWLFDMPYEDIEVVVHPEAIIHSMVQFPDGAIKAQMGVPDMTLPIQFALTYPYRLASPAQRYVFGPGEQFSFFEPEWDLFPCLRMAIEAGKAGGNVACVLNAANEVAVSEFLKGRIPFPSIARVVQRTLETSEFIDHPTLDDYVATNAAAREAASWLVDKLTN